MAQIEYTSRVERESPRRRLWYWEIKRNGATCAAGFQKVKADAEQRVADELRLHRAVDAAIASAS